MSLPALDNLVRVGQFKAEPRNEAEVKRMLAMARTRLADAQVESVSREGRFISAYNAAHAAALAALRWHGYRSENRTRRGSSLALTYANARPRFFLTPFLFCVSAHNALKSANSINV